MGERSTTARKETRFQLCVCRKDGKPKKEHTHTLPRWNECTPKVVLLCTFTYYQISKIGREKRQNAKCKKKNEKNKKWKWKTKEEKLPKRNVCENALCKYSKLIYSKLCEQSTKKRDNNNNDCSTSKNWNQICGKVREQILIKVCVWSERVDGMGVKKYKSKNMMMIQIRKKVFRQHWIVE